MELADIFRIFSTVWIFPAVVAAFCLVELLRWLYRKSQRAAKKGHYRKMIFNDTARFREISLEEKNMKVVYDPVTQKRYIDKLSCRNMDLILATKPTIDGGPSTQIFSDNELTATNIFSYMKYDKNMKLNGFWARMSYFRSIFNDQLSLLFDNEEFVDDFLKFMEKDMEIPRQYGQQVVIAINLCRSMITQGKEVMLVVAKRSLFLLEVKDQQPRLTLYSIRYLFSVRASMIKFLVKNDDIVKNKFYDLVNKYIDRTVTIDIKDVNENTENKAL